MCETQKIMTKKDIYVENDLSIKYNIKQVENIFCQFVELHSQNLVLNLLESQS